MDFEQDNIKSNDVIFHSTHLFIMEIMIVTTICNINDVELQNVGRIFLQLDTSSYFETSIKKT